jgi:hypothetical protein
MVFTRLRETAAIFGIRLDWRRRKAPVIMAFAILAFLVFVQLSEGIWAGRIDPIQSASDWARAECAAEGFRGKEFHRLDDYIRAQQETGASYAEAKVAGYEFCALEPGPDPYRRRTCDECITDIAYALYRY